MKKLGSVVRSQQFDRETLEEVFRIASEMEKDYNPDLLKGKGMAALFYEPSLRTRHSFEAAMQKLGGWVISTENAREFSSAAKGETLEDTVRVESGYVDVISIRYDEEGGAERAANFSRVPVINTGDGPGQHPTQGLLDLYTIKKRFGKIEGLKIAMVGDLFKGRTVRSLCYFFGQLFPNNKLFLVSPRLAAMRKDIKDHLDEHGVEWEELTEMDSILSEIDVWYQTRGQSERYKNNPQQYEEVRRESRKLNITVDTLGYLKKEMIIMHPLPRVDEISHAVDHDSRAWYFQQAENGLYVRMALLKMILIGY